MSCSTSLKLLLLVLITIHSAHSVKTTAVFVVSWLAGHCEYIRGKCDPNVLNRWDHRSFTINGLWPSYQSYSNAYGPFDLGLLSRSYFFDDMKTYWPPQPQLGGKPYFLWELQWKDHGAAFSEIQLQLSRYSSSNTKQRNEQLQKAYFEVSLKLYKKFNLMNMNSGLVKKVQLAKRMKISQNSFYLICTDSGVLRQIRICVDLAKASPNTFDCNRPDKNCNDVITLKDWVNPKSDAQMQAQRQWGDYQRKVRSDAENAQMQASWNVNKAKGQSRPSAQQKEEIDFYQQEVSWQELDFQLRGFGFVFLSWLLVAILMCLCVMYLKKNSKKTKKSLLQQANNIEIQPTSNDSRPQALQMQYAEP